jgi:GntR family transcriptional regulator, transcriptional repressor for pyruvate dehydrogenase complex
MTDGHGAGSPEEKIAPSRVVRAFDQVAMQLRDLILGGQLTPGDRLPIEGELSTAFGVSRSTVREALRVLASEGLVRTVRGIGGGSFVTEPDTEQVTSFLQMHIQLLTGSAQVSLDELIQARALLEVPAAGLAAERRKPDDLDRLDELNGLRPTESIEIHRVSREFHLVIVDMAGNRLLRLMAEPVFNVLGHRFLAAGPPDEQGRRVLDEEHLALTEAIRAGDAERARKIMQGHLGVVEAVYRRRARSGEGT